MTNWDREFTLKVFTVGDALDWLKRQTIENLLVWKDQEYQQAFRKELQNYEQ